ncbi:MAG: hypothetical protein ACR2GL_06980 [Thermoleophilaceae bacterium]
MAGLREKLSRERFEASAAEGAELTIEAAAAEAVEGRNGHRGRPATG